MAGILVVNAGSSSVKLSLIGEDDETLAARELAAPRAQIDPDELRRSLSEFGAVNIVVHRIVHGGDRFQAPVPIDQGVREELERLVDLAPLHQPKSLAALDAVSQALPETQAIACFDTAFHSSLAPAVSTYALPRRWNEHWRLRRYGFHGLSHAWVSRRTHELLGGSSRDRLIISCHLGAGASLCAIEGNRSVETTMGFTPLDGLVMATRSGSVDPGLLLWLQEHTELTETEIAYALEHESGLLGLSGTSDMREVLARAAAGDEEAELALEVYLHRLRTGIGSMAAALGGLDALAFTGGVGENSSEVRERAVDGLGFLGLSIDSARNRAATGDAEVSAHAEARILVIHAREDLEMVRQVRAVLAGRA